jgi:hypothetical protein
MVRTTFPLAAILCIALAAAFFAGSGFNAIVDGEANVEQVSDEVNDTANDSVGGPGELSGSRSGGDDSIVGLAIAGARNVGTFMALILLLPLTLQELGFPAWFALPVGGVLEIIVSIGVIQFVVGRVLR